ncbi:hypothetical protein POKO110462_00050 [Pontibacter korlensis]|uniref:Uncharacterized protein n=1 Tax=Pontibacter korlensis TaxID=400092 RepID=A0A0E3ZCM7_9BACT|nr:hypothetical protein [Pontibacter korlensis]AKD02693.1 hypothetical protein PKOR_05590 [Pontibacter korlensis]
MKPGLNNEAPDELYLDVRLLNNLYETAKWGKVLAVLGFILSAFTLVFGLFMQRLAKVPALEGAADIGFSGFTIVVYAFVALVYFFPSLYLYSFSSRMQQGVQERNQQQVYRAINQLNILFKFLVIMLILFLLLFGLSLLMLVTGASQLSL